MIVDTGVEADVDALSNNALEKVVRASCFRLGRRHGCDSCSATQALLKLVFVCENLVADRCESVVLRLQQ